MLKAVFLINKLKFLLLDTPNNICFVNKILYEKLIRKYENKEWDTSQMHPSLQAVQNDPDYEVYLRKQEENKALAKFKTFKLAPSVIDTFNPIEFENNEKPREYGRIK